MNINKKDLDRHSWWELEDGTIIENESVMPKEVLDGYCVTFHSLFPLEITEHVSSYCWVPHSKLHKVLCHIKPLYYLLEKRHHTEKTFHHIMDINSTIGRGNEEIIMAMVNSGDYTLSQALLLWSQSCERCMNVLANKYGFGDGYEEFSEEWKKCNTKCRFCEGLDE